MLLLLLLLPTCATLCHTCVYALWFWAQAVKLHECAQSPQRRCCRRTRTSVWRLSLPVAGFCLYWPGCMHQALQAQPSHQHTHTHQHSSTEVLFQPLRTVLCSPTHNMQVHGSLAAERGKPPSTPSIKELFRLIGEAAKIPVLWFFTWVGFLVSWGTRKLQERQAVCQNWKKVLSKHVLLQPANSCAVVCCPRTQGRRRGICPCCSTCAA